MAAAGVPVGRRLVHVHNLDEAVLTPNALKQAVLRPTLRRVCLAMADQIVANSDHSLDKFLAGHRRDPRRHRVHYDRRRSHARSPQRTWTAPQFRRSLGLAEDAPILLFAGRVTPEKNPVFAVDVLAALRRRMSEAVGVFAGTGSLEGEVRERAAALGQSDAIRMIGWRDDVADIMSACDWFILPHPHHPAEGFGIAVVEAQLTGLRLLLSLGRLRRADPAGRLLAAPGAGRRGRCLGRGSGAALERAGPIARRGADRVARLADGSRPRARRHAGAARRPRAAP